MSHQLTIAQELSIAEKQVSTTLQLLEGGATIPFIARYRKEMTGSLDEVQVMNIRDRFQQLVDLEKRKEAILKSIEEQGKLDDTLRAKIVGVSTMAELEDIYLPYKPKRRTRASMARDKGLQGLADFLLAQQSAAVDAEVDKYINTDLGVHQADEALAGARDIIAEQINEDAAVRSTVRELFLAKGTFVSKVVPGKEAEAVKFKDYFECSESLKDAPSHRVLAMRRGEKEELLYLDIHLDEAAVLPLVEKKYVIANNEASKHVKMAIQDGYKRLLKPSMETELRVLSRQKADDEAIRVFADNVRQLLLAAPLGEQRVLAIDPGFRTGCKTVVLDAQGNLLENTAIFPHASERQLADAIHTMESLVKKYAIQAIAIGNGTAGRETEAFVRKLAIPDVQVVMVNESGASIYSASEVAREEFPDYDVTVRGAVSIGRRLMDPLAELVKIEPKSIGVGQYQHDVDQNKLQSALDDTVVSCVNAVGVELNTASKQILSYISGLGPSLAQQIVNYRKENGAFKSRKELTKVPRLGAKAFEQAAGFLRIRNGQHPLDASAVHPERYALVERMAKDMQVNVADLLNNADLRKQIKLSQYVSDEVGLPTLNDIMSELAKPGLDPREQFQQFSFTEGVNAISDLRIGMKLQGIVTNITNFGVFVDIGVHQDGLVHLSQLSNRFVTDPHDIVKVQQHVQVTVTEVDEGRKRISLSMKDDQAKERKGPSGSVKRDSSRGGSKGRPSQRNEETSMAEKLAQLASKFK